MRLTPSFIVRPLKFSSSPNLKFVVRRYEMTLIDLLALFVANYLAFFVANRRVAGRGRSPCPCGQLIRVSASRSVVPPTYTGDQARACVFSSIVTPRRLNVR
jgi:hypothetical protein